LSPSKRDDILEETVADSSLRGTTA